MGTLRPLLIRVQRDIGSQVGVSAGEAELARPSSAYDQGNSCLALLSFASRVLRDVRCYKRPEGEVLEEAWRHPSMRVGAIVDPEACIQAALDDEPAAGFQNSRDLARVGRPRSRFQVRPYEAIDGHRERPGRETVVQPRDTAKVPDNVLELDPSPPLQPLPRSLCLGQQLWVRVQPFNRLDAPSCQSQRRPCPYRSPRPTRDPTS